VIDPGGGRLDNRLGAAIRQLLDAHLRRIEWDPAGCPVRLYPFTKKRQPQELKVDALRFFRGTGVGGHRNSHGDDRRSVQRRRVHHELAEDYGRPRLEIEEAVRSELQFEAA